MSDEFEPKRNPWRTAKWVPKVLICLKPIQTKHGPDRKSMSWWRVVPVVVCLGFRDGWWNYGVHYSGRRLWLYTKWGAIHFDAWMQTKAAKIVSET